MFSKNEGIISSYRFQDHELIKSGPRENYYRAPTDFDLLMGNSPAPIHKWRAAGLDKLERTVISFNAVQNNSKMVEVRIRSRLCGLDQQEGFNSDLIYHVYANGEIMVTNKVIVDERPPFVPQEGMGLILVKWLESDRWKWFIPRVGVELIIPEDLEILTWFGRGPHENYVDRKSGAAFGYYRSTVTQQFTPYVYPSECGGKEDVRWLALTNNEGAGLLVIGLDKFHFDALHYSIRDLEEAKHLDKLTPRQETILHLDGWHMGVGGDDGWMAQVHKEFLIYAGIYWWSYKLKPITTEDNPSVVARTTVEGEY
jgi:beta-galactosidase